VWAISAFGIIGAAVTLLFVIPAPHESKPSRRPVLEDFSTAPPPCEPEHASREELERSGPVAAIIIDDMGYDFRIDSAFLEIEAPLSFAFLPSAPHTRELALRAHEYGKDILVHLPMEPMKKEIDPGPGALYLDMNFNTMLRTVRRAIKSVPGASGVNNHMGSRFTADRRAMEVVLNELKRHGLFYIDSRTTEHTVGFSTARALGIPSAERTVFLDHDHRRNAIKRGLDQLVWMSEKRGSALAIGHPLPETLSVLYDALPVLRKKVRLVPVSKMLSSP